MNKSITQDNLNDNQISKSIRRFFTRFHLSSALKAANAYKKKGTSATLIFQYLFLLIFSNRSMYMNLLIGKDTAYSVCILPPARKNPATLPVKICHVTGFPCQ